MGGRFGAVGWHIWMAFFWMAFSAVGFFRFFFSVFSQFLFGSSGFSGFFFFAPLVDKGRGYEEMR
jgi:hypothetical protein